MYSCDDGAVSKLVGCVCVCGGVGGETDNGSDQTDNGDQGVKLIMEVIKLTTVLHIY